MQNQRLSTAPEKATEHHYLPGIVAVKSAYSMGLIGFWNWVEALVQKTVTAL